MASNPLQVLEAGLREWDDSQDMPLTPARRGAGSCRRGVATFNHPVAIDAGTLEVGR